MSGWTEEDAAYLMSLDTDRRTAEARIRAQVAWMRQHECPWSVIGHALGISKQGAAQKYGSTRTSLEDRPLPLDG